MNAVNDAPVLNTIPPQQFAQNTQTTLANLPQFVTDVDSSSFTFMITAEDTNKVDCLINGNNFVMSPALNYNGAASCTLIANDGASNSNEQVVSITVTSVNAIPTSSSNTLSTNEDITLTLATNDFNFADTDAGDSLQKVQITSLPNQGSLQLSGNNVNLNQEITATDISNLKFMPVQNANGNPYTTFQFKVSDGKDYSTESIMTINVNAVNDAPTLSSLSDKTYDEDSGLQNDIFDMQALASDVETAANGLTYSIQSQSNAAIVNCVIDINRFVDCTTQQDKNGFSDVTVRVNDSQNAFAERTFRVTINPVNDPPSITPISIQSATEDSQFTLDVVAADVDNTNLQYSLSQMPSGMQIDSTGKITWLPNNAQVGSNAVTVQVSDGSLIDTESFTIDVVNAAPQITSTAITSATVTRSYSYNVEATDEGQGGEYRLLTNPTGMTIDTNTGVISWTPLVSQKGQHTVMMEFDDKHGGITVQNFSIDVTGLPDLVVEQLQVRSPVNPTTSVDTLIKFIIRNIGNADANNVQWKLDFQDGFRTQPDTPTIKAGEFLLVYDYVRFIVPDITGTTHNITAIADPNNPNNAIDEILETNNLQTIQKSVS